MHRLITTVCYELSMNLKREKSFRRCSFLCCCIINLMQRQSAFGKTCCPRGNMGFKGFLRAVWGGFLRGKQRGCVFRHLSDAGHHLWQNSRGRPSHKQGWLQPAHLDWNREPDSLRVFPGAVSQDIFTAYV